MKVIEKKLNLHGFQYGWRSYLDDLVRNDLVESDRDWLITLYRNNQHQEIEQWYLSGALGLSIWN